MLDLINPLEPVPENSAPKASDQSKENLIDVLEKGNDTTQSSVAVYMQKFIEGFKLQDETDSPTNPRHLTVQPALTSPPQTIPVSFPSTSAVLPSSGKKGLPPLMVAQAIAPFLQVRSNAGIFYRYNSSFGIYEKTTEDELVALIYAYARESILQNGRPSFAWDILKTLRDDIQYRIAPTPHLPALAFRNGLLDLFTRKLMEHSPEYFLTTAIDANWCPGARCPIFENFLISICGENDQLKKRIWEFMGCILLADSSAKVIFLLEGPPDSGKTTLTRLLQYLLYPDNVVATFNQKDLNSRFAIQRLENAVLCLMPDLPDEPLSRKTVSLLKQLSGSDRVSGDVKYKNWKEFTYNGNLLLASNHEIALEEYDAAFESRLKRIPFKNNIPRYNQDPQLLERFMQEASAIATKACESYLNLIQQPGWSFSGSYERDCLISRQPVDYYSVSISGFLKSYVEPLSEKEWSTGVEPVTDIIVEPFVEDVWKAWKNETHLCLTLPSFSKRMWKLLDRRPGGNRKRREGEKNAQSKLFGYKLILRKRCP